MLTVFDDKICDTYNIKGICASIVAEKLCVTSRADKSSVHEAGELPSGNELEGNIHSSMRPILQLKKRQSQRPSGKMASKIDTSRPQPPPPPPPLPPPGLLSLSLSDTFSLSVFLLHPPTPSRPSSLLSLIYSAFKEQVDGTARIALNFLVLLAICVIHLGQHLHII
jgi:hypothetical protein